MDLTDALYEIMSDTETMQHYPAPFDEARTRRSRIAMKIFVSAIKNKKDATEKEKVMAEKMASSYDISEIKYIEPIVMYLGEKDNEKAV
jgi:hypothetical protein